LNLVAKATILDAAETARVLRRMAGEIVEAQRGVEGLIIVGIRSRGVPMAEAICTEIERLEGKRRRWEPSTSRSIATTSR